MIVTVVLGANLGSWIYGLPVRMEHLRLIISILQDLGFGSRGVAYSVWALGHPNICRGCRDGQDCFHKILPSVGMSCVFGYCR